MMRKKLYNRPLTERFHVQSESLLISASDYNNTPDNPERQETIEDGGEVEDGDFANGNNLFSEEEDFLGFDLWN